jgi:sialate O-acetylesterase
MIKLKPLFILFTLLVATPVFANVRVPALIGDNMVLQRDRKIRIWGWADPNERVTVAIGKDQTSAVTDSSGRWQALVGPLKTGDPLELKITGNNTLTFKNILVGEVWVCSGQSNMEWPLINTKNGAQDVAQANFPEIRLFTVQKATASAPLDDVKGQWAAATPENAGQFSAVAYYFGRELYQKLKIPVGLIHTSWGGTPAEAWTDHATLASSPEFKPILDRYQTRLKDLPQQREEYERRLAEWTKTNLYLDQGNNGEALGYADLSTSVQDWKPMTLPQFFETAGLKMDGAIWFRKEVQVPEGWAGHDLQLNLAAIDDFDTTYFNGKRIGGVGSETPNSYIVQRQYKVPAGLVKPGRNVIAVRVFDSAGEGGFGPGPMTLTMANAAPVQLAGEWQYKIELQLAPKDPDWGARPEAPGPTNQNSPSVLYNAMLAPLTPYAIRGAIWYQGESNAGRAYQYRTLFPAMIRNWRSAWGEGDFPFYFVQLANFQQVKPDPGDSDWAELREAQTLTLKEPATGMAVIIDIGEANDIHPRNKLDVGHRLALWALANTYKQSVEFSGPVFSSYKVEGDKVRVKFSHTAGQLKTADGGAPKGFAIAGEDHKFVWAESRIDGDSVLLWSKDVTKPVAVRYAWADNPVTNLYNKEGLPAVPFRTDDWPGITMSRK